MIYLIQGEFLLKILARDNVELHSLCAAYTRWIDHMMVRIVETELSHAIRTEFQRLGPNIQRNQIVWEAIPERIRNLHPRFVRFHGGA